MKLLNEISARAQSENAVPWKQEQLETAFPVPARHMQPISFCLRGLVVSADDEIRQKLAESLDHCSLRAILASSSAEALIALTRHNVCMVLCAEFVTDGDYRGVVEIAKRVDRNLPVIVVSRTGDWPEYLEAMNTGIFDYLAYPPIPGELPRVIRGAFLTRLRHQETLPMEGSSIQRAGGQL